MTWGQLPDAPAPILSELQKETVWSGVGGIQIRIRRCWDGFARPVCWEGPYAGKGPGLDLMLCHLHLEILNSF